MPAVLKNNLLLWAQKLHSTCLTLNEALIGSFKLNDKLLLVGGDRFAFPGIAVRQGLLPRRGSLQEQPVTYHLHGTGITFVIEEQVKVSFNYFPRVSRVDTPLWGCYELAEFIRSTSPLDPLGNKALIRVHAVALVQEGMLGRVDDFAFQFYLVMPGALYTPIRILAPCS